ncbi:SusC/RagA family TonB-linked outer membrane protein [Salinimicrobium sp. CAU 1759]
MKTKFSGILTLLLALVVQITFAQEQRTITGTVTDDSGMPLPGVNVLVKGTTRGVQTGFDGDYSIEASPGEVLVFSFLGMQTREYTVANVNTIDVVLQPDAAQLEEVVVTALGISREKRSIGYATQEVSGEEVSTVKTDNVINNLSGKVSGVQIKANNNFGGSANFLIRGVSSLTGNNQPLFVIDGIPISNNINNTAAQRAGSTGYDYGNAASDINPEDVASINVLKGAAASAIYGSRGANGVVIITTKSGQEGRMKVSVSSSVTVGEIDKSTFIDYQDEYGAGYGPYYGAPDFDGYFELFDVDGNGTTDRVVPTYDDASYGAPLDGQVVFQWDAFVPEHQNYLQPRPYVAGATTPVDFFETSLQFNNSVAVSGGTEKMTYRLGYTNFDQTGMLPNSNLNKNSFNLNGDIQVTDNLSAGASANFIVQRTTGRNSTGYSDNLMSQFRQWWQVNVDMDSQREIFEQTGKNISWNHEGALGGSYLQPHYWDNPYWTRYRNYQTDRRNRFYGNLFASYNVTDWLDITAKGAVDTYSELREERRAIGSVAAPFGVLRDDETSGYDRKDVDFTEYNYDLMANINKDFGDDVSLAGVAGINLRRETYSFYHQATAGGLIAPGIFALSNSVNTNPKPVEILQEKEVLGYYGQASVGYQNTAYLDGTYRYDISSALPPDENGYGYFAVSTSLIFSNLFDSDWFSFGKFRAGYAEVGNDLPANNVYDTYNILNNFGQAALFSFPGTKQNEELVPERTKEIEVGIETRMWQNRVGLDLTWYKKNTENQLMPVSLSTATGFSNRWVNAGELQNKGVEARLHLVPVTTDDWNWTMDINWSKNENLVVDLYGDQENLVLASYQGGVSLNATVGQPYNTLRGTGYQYLDGQRVVNSSGYYVAVADQVIGDANPDWNGGVSNKISYKNVALSFLVDVQQGGDVFSLDLHYGQGTGLPDYTAGLNELGNPVRDPISEGGGVLNEGVTADGQPNTTRARADYFGGAYYWGNSSRNPNQINVYDASYVKLREVALSYRMPVKEWFGDSMNSGTISLIGRNLWIIDKNVPFADPESGLGAGNAQGYLSGSYPTLRTVGLSVNFEF